RSAKHHATLLSVCCSAQPRLFGLSAAPDPRFRNLLPPVQIGVGPKELAAIAAYALTPQPEPVIEVNHLHAAQVNVREQARLLAGWLRRATSMTFRGLCADAPDTITKVARFLAALELFRHDAVSFEQSEPLSDVYIRWTGGDEDIDISDEFDLTGGTGSKPEQTPSSDNNPPVF